MGASEDVRANGVQPVLERPGRVLPILVVLGVYIGLPVLILLDIIPFSLKFAVLAIGALAVYAIARVSGASNAELGIKKDQSLKSLFDIAPLTLILLVAGIVVWIGGWGRIDQNEVWQFYVFYVFVSCPAQELLYRGALTVFLERISVNRWFVLIGSSALFAFVHVIYRDTLTVVLMFGIGLIWYLYYRRTRNLLGVIVSHATLGAVTIIAGVVN